MELKLYKLAEQTFMAYKREYEDRNNCDVGYYFDMIAALDVAIGLVQEKIKSMEVTGNDTEGNGS